MDRGNHDGEDEGAGSRDSKKKKIIIRVVYGQGPRSSTPLGSCSSLLCLQADECWVDMEMAKKYHQIHKVCKRHSKAILVLVCGIRHRFSQQHTIHLGYTGQTKFHEISEFDDTKSSCRERLAGHNERGRKTHPDLHSGNGQHSGSSFKTTS